jgi:hypothetical protein
MDDQPFAGKHLERGRWIEVAAGLLSVGRRAMDDFVAEQKKVLDGRRYRVERRLALPCGKPNFEDAVFARQHDRLAELRPNCEIGFFVSALRGSNRAGPCQRYEDSEGAQCQQAIGATGVQCVAQARFVHGNVLTLAKVREHRTSRSARLPRYHAGSDL